MKFKGENIFFLVLLVVSFIWIRSGVGKVVEGKFGGGLEGTLSKFASQNPYPFVKSFLEDTLIPNASLLAPFVMYSEVLAGLAIGAGALSVLLSKKTNMPMLRILSVGLLLGALLNGSFYLAAGWTSPSTDGLNLLMLAIEILGLIYLFKKAQD